jgi:parallel beta-helix repeat protein
VVEVSSRALLAGNTFTSNVGSGLLVINTDRVEVANNTVSNNQQRGIALTTGDRSRADQKAAADSRHPNDRSMVWITRDVSAYNNMVEGGGRCLVCVEDQRARPTPAMTSIRLDHNAYHRTAGSPGAFATWPVRGRTVEYPTFAAYRGGTGQDTHSREVDNRKTKPLAEQSEVLRTLSGTARPLSPAVAQATGKPAATRRIGAWTTFSS